MGEYYLKQLLETILNTAIFSAILKHSYEENLLTRQKV